MSTENTDKQSIPPPPPLPTVSSNDQNSEKKENSVIPPPPTLEEKSTIPTPPPPPVSQKVEEKKDNIIPLPTSNAPVVEEKSTIPPPPPTTITKVSETKVPVPPTPPPILSKKDESVTPPPTVSQPVASSTQVVAPPPPSTATQLQSNAITKKESEPNITVPATQNINTYTTNNMDKQKTKSPVSGTTTKKIDSNTTPLRQQKTPVQPVTTTGIRSSPQPEPEEATSVTKSPPDAKSSENKPLRGELSHSIAHPTITKDYPTDTINSTQPNNFRVTNYNQNTLAPYSLKTPVRGNNIVNSRYIEAQPIENINTHYHKRELYKSSNHEKLQDISNRIKQRKIFPSGISDSALIAPKNESEGWITSVGIDNPHQRGIHQYNIKNQNTRNPEVKLTQLIQTNGSGGQIMGICYMKSLDLLFYHSMNGEVFEHNPRLGTTTRIFRTSEFTEEDLIAPGCTLKEDKEGNDLLVMCSTMKIVVLHTMKSNGFESLVSLNGLTDHHFTDFHPINKDMVISLTNTGMIIIHSYTPDSSSLLHYVMLNEVAVNQNISAVMFSVCSQSQYLTVATYNKENITRDKLYYLQLKDNYVPEIIDILDFENDAEPSNRDSGPIITNINMDYYIEDQPLVICSEIENKQRMQLYLYGHKAQTNPNGAYSKAKLRKVDEQNNLGLGLNSKRIGRSLYSLLENGNIIKQDVTRNEPDKLRVSRMTNSRYIQRSTVLGYPVSAGVTPSRVIPPGAVRPERYKRNPPPTVVSCLKTAIEDLGRSVSPGSFHKGRIQLPANAQSRIIDQHPIHTKEFKPVQTPPVKKQAPSTTPQRTMINGVEYITEVTTSPGGTKRIMKRPARKTINTPIKQTPVQKQTPSSQHTIMNGVEYETQVTTSPGGTKRIIKKPLRKSNLVVKKNLPPPQPIKPPKPKTIIRQSGRTVPSSIPKQPVTMIKLPNGKLVPKDGPEAQAFFKGIEEKNKKNQIQPKAPTKVTTSLVPQATKTTVIKRESTQPKAGTLLDRSNYKAQDFDSTKRVIRNQPTSTFKPSSRVVSTYQPRKEPIRTNYKPHSEFTPWNVKKSSEKPKVISSSGVKREPVEKVYISPAHRSVQKSESQINPSSLPSKKQSFSHELKEAIEHQKGVTKYQTGFDGCKLFSLPF